MYLYSTGFGNQGQGRPNKHAHTQPGSSPRWIHPNHCANLVCPTSHGEVSWNQGWTIPSPLQFLIKREYPWARVPWWEMMYGLMCACAGLPYDGFFSGMGLYSQNMISYNTPKSLGGPRGPSINPTSPKSKVNYPTIPKKFTLHPPPTTRQSIQLRETCPSFQPSCHAGCGLMNSSGCPATAVNFFGATPLSTLVMAGGIAPPKAEEKNVALEQSLRHRCLMATNTNFFQVA